MGRPDNVWMSGRSDLNVTTCVFRQNDNVAHSPSQLIIFNYINMGLCSGKYYNRIFHNVLTNSFCVFLVEYLGRVHIDIWA